MVGEWHDLCHTKAAGYPGGTGEYTGESEVNTVLDPLRPVFPRGDRPMTRTRWWLALPALLVAISGLANAAEIRDRAGLFSADATRKAQADLDRIEGEYQVPVVIEAIESLDGRSIDVVLPEHAGALAKKGLYVLIARQDHKIQADVYKSYKKYFPRTREIAIRSAFEKDFGRGDFDAGLAKGVEKIDSTFSEARAEAGGTLRPTTPPAVRRGAAPAPAGRAAIPGKSSWGAGSLITIVLGILAVLLVFRIIRALFSAGRGGYANQNQMMGRGPGGPGYGGGGGGYGGAPAGGGGFMSSMFGGIGGALAGNWLYDQFSGGRHQSGYTDQNTIDPGATAGAAGEAAGPDWVGPNDGGGDWGGGGGDGGGNWGGDAGGGGGGGGGDWGGDAGGGGGGDWGGGGGGGGDDGGSW